ncbi:MAG: hypothetical protein HY071_06805 [Chloroflexi bacterium]|nr:hypothetical protein [Chloroflexota bacterium]
MSAAVDPGSVLLAGAAATVGGSLVLAVLPRHGRVAVDVPLAIGQRLALDARSGFATGVVLHVAFGIAWAFVSALLWWWTDMPIGPLSGALFALPQWLAAEIAIGAVAAREDLGGRRAFAPHRESLTLLGSHLIYGALFGTVYKPGS